MIPVPRDVRVTEAVGRGMGGAFDYWNMVAYGGIYLEGTAVFNWIDLGHTRAERDALVFPGGRSIIAQWGVDAAARNGIDLSRFSAIIIVLNAPSDHGSAGGNRMILGYPPEVWEPTFIFHEMGHCFGLNHSWRAYPDVVYGDTWDMMSAMAVHLNFDGNYGSPAGPGLCAQNLRLLGCMMEPRILRPDKNQPRQVVKLAALSEPQARGYLMVEIPPFHLGRTQDVGYTVEFRAQSGWDKSIPGETVLVHEVRNGTPFLVLPNLVAGGQTRFTSPRGGRGELQVTLLTIDALAGTADIELILTVEQEPARCGEIRTTVAELKAERAVLQEELKAATSGPEKAALAQRIKALNRKLDDLDEEARDLGCAP